ncbi:MAG: hypothetical protein ACRENQ_01795, partial [Gemmatimonadaceae bacterium]
VELRPEVARAITEALESGREAPSAAAGAPDGSSAAPGVHRGQASGADPASHRKERFFRAVDRAILTHYSHPSGLPLLLVALPENHTTFRRISHNPMLMAKGIDTNPEALSIEALRDRAWQVVKPHYLARLAGLIDMFGVARAKELGTDDLAQAMRAAVAGRVATLLIEADRQIPGHVDAATGGIEFDELAQPTVDDLLDDLGELVMHTGGQVVIVPSDAMPTRSGLAAIYRF